VAGAASTAKRASKVAEISDAALHAWSKESGPPFRVSGRGGGAAKKKSSCPALLRRCGETTGHKEGPAAVGFEVDKPGAGSPSKRGCGSSPLRRKTPTAWRRGVTSSGRSEPHRLAHSRRSLRRILGLWPVLGGTTRDHERGKSVGLGGRRRGVPRIVASGALSQGEPFVAVPDGGCSR